MTGYETIYIFSPDATDDEVKKIKTKVEKIIKGTKGELVAWDDWGQKRFAYPIRKFTRGRYFYVAYTSQGGAPEEIERNLKIEDNVIRFMTVKLGVDFDTVKFKKDFVGRSLLDKKPETPVAATPAE